MRAVKEEVALLDILEVVPPVALVGGAVDVVEVVMRRYPQKIWMLNWRSTMLRLCKQIEGNKLFPLDLRPLIMENVQSNYCAFFCLSFRPQTQFGEGEAMI